MVYCTRSAAPLCRVSAAVHVLHVEVLFMSYTELTFGSQRTPNRDGSIIVFFLTNTSMVGRVAMVLTMQSAILRFAIRLANALIIRNML